MSRYALRDDQWERIKHLLPGKAGDVGVTASDNRRFVEAVLYRYRAGIPWRDLPERFGDMQREVLRIWQQTQRRSCSSRTISTRQSSWPTASLSWRKGQALCLMSKKSVCPGRVSAKTRKSRAWRDACHCSSNDAADGSCASSRRSAYCWHGSWRVAGGF